MKKKKEKNMGIPYSYILVYIDLSINIHCYFSGTNMYTVYLPISGKSIDLVSCKLFLHVR